MTRETVRVSYRCRCTPQGVDAQFDVRARLEGEDVADWMDVMTTALGVDHARRSPWCNSTKTEYVKIPLPENAPFIGAAPKLDS